MNVLSRHLAVPILASLKDSPVVFLQGARQTGKGTLTQSLRGKFNRTFQ
jgi:predicted AAA+ superfamily ATPase